MALAYDTVMCKILDGQSRYGHSADTLNFTMNWFNWDFTMCMTSKSEGSIPKG